MFSTWLDSPTLHTGQEYKVGKLAVKDKKKTKKNNKRSSLNTLEAENGTLRRLKVSNKKLSLCIEQINNSFHFLIHLTAA